MWQLGHVYWWGTATVRLAAKPRSKSTCPRKHFQVSSTNVSDDESDHDHHDHHGHSHGQHGHAHGSHEDEHVSFLNNDVSEKLLPHNHHHD